MSAVNSDSWPLPCGTRPGKPNSAASTSGFPKSVSAMKVGFDGSSTLSRTYPLSQYDMAMISWPSISLTIMSWLKPEAGPRVGSMMLGYRASRSNSPARTGWRGSVMS